MELSKDIDLDAWKRNSAAACYAGAAASQQKSGACMISASGEMICVPQSTPFYDGAAAILGQPSRAVCAQSHNNVASIEPFENDSMQKCIDGSMSSRCVTQEAVAAKK